MQPSSQYRLHGFAFERLLSTMILVDNYVWIQQYILVIYTTTSFIKNSNWPQNYDTNRDDNDFGHYGLV